MSRIPLLGGAYKQASLIAGAQRSVNLYPEFNSERAQAPVPVTHYSRPGLTPLGTPPIVGTGRALYAATTGQLYCVINQSVFFIDANYNYTLLGMLPSAVSTPVIISDNGVTAFLVDGSLFGSQIQLSTNTMTQITDPNFLGGTHCDFIDGFVVFNQPNTTNWYCTQFYSNVFNNLFIGQKTAWPDLITTLIVNERQVWLFGKYKAEVWFNAGLAPFPFQLISGSIVEQGIVGPYAIARQDVNIYWLSESPEGARMAMQGAGIANQATRISTNAIEQEWLSYPTVNDCICSTYQIRGHPFIHFDFPTADRSWVYDGSTNEWHEEAWYDTNGVQHRTKDTFRAYTYGLNLSLDWSTGQLYQRDETNFTDNGIPLRYIRGFPHVVDGNNFNRLTVWRFIADMECGTGSLIEQLTRGGGSYPGIMEFGIPILEYPGGVTIIENIYPQVWLKISRDRGNTFVTHSVQPLGVGPPPGYNTKPTFNRCGMAYDFVFMLEWSGPVQTALNGAFIVAEEHTGDE